MTSRVAVERRFFEQHPGAVFDEAWHKPVVLTRFQVEQYLDALPEMRLLYPEHWAEVALDRGTIPLAPDYATYEIMAKAGMLHLVTARLGDTLVGYIQGTIRTHLHSRASLTCFTDFFYLKPEYRKGMAGYLMLKFFRDGLVEKRVQKVYVGVKLSLDVGALFERLGFRATERVYSQVL